VEPLQFIQEKRDGRPHPAEAIAEFISALTKGQVPD
jgi:thymidine phosphorylase